MSADKSATAAGAGLAPEQIAELRKKYNATLVWQRRANPDLAVMRIRPDFPLPSHKPGQYSTLGLGNWEPRVAGCQEEHLSANDEQKIVRRAYSIGCSVLDEQGNLLDRRAVDWLEFYIVLVRESDKEKPPALTPRLFQLQEGGRLYLGEKITGHFTLDPVRPTDAVVFLGTGTGEAPHNYMLWELLRRGHAGRILSACCVRYRRDLAYVDIHQELMRRYPNYTYLSLTTREADTVGHKVYIQDLITSGQLEERLGVPLDPAQTHVYLCGNPKMIGVPSKDRETGQLVHPKPTGVVELLAQRGFQIDLPAQKVKGNIHFEEYW
ncbi:MAG: ferredoxin--NADP reductase [Gemmataceae bacterium]|nr:ferredoxin--NADP reductase [Gemmataceae bacterium]